MSGTNVWKNIKGYDGKYQISYEGEIRKVYQSGKTRILAQYTRKNSGNRLFIRLTKDEKRKEFPVHTLVAQAFLRESKEGEVLYHINGLLNDNWASNLEYIDRRKLGELTGAQSRRKGVVKIDSNCEMVDFYPSAREAGRENFMSYQTIIDRCNRKVKSPFAPDGYAYAWEDCSDSVKSAVKKIKLAQNKDIA